MKTALFLFNSSSYAVQPWLDSEDWACVSVDFNDTDHSGSHRRHDDDPNHHRLNIDLSKPQAAQWIDEGLASLGLEKPSFILSFTPCTDLSVAGNRHRAAKLKANPDCIKLAVRQARLVEAWPCPSIVENPVSILSTEWKKPEGYVDPYQFSYLLDDDDVHPEFPEIYPAGDWYNKKTGLWCQNGAVMPKVDSLHKHIRPDEVFVGWSKLGGKSARTKYIRSLTPRGMAKAIYLANGVEK
jgi:hypothetical protein